MDDYNYIEVLSSNVLVEGLADKFLEDPVLSLWPFTPLKLFQPSIDVVIVETLY